MIIIFEMKGLVLFLFGITVATAALVKPLSDGVALSVGLVGAEANVDDKGASVKVDINSGKGGKPSGEKKKGPKNGSGSGSKSSSGSDSGQDDGWPNEDPGQWDSGSELCLASGPAPCPKVIVTADWVLGEAQGQWFLWASDNDFNAAGCIGCNTAQIAYWQQVGKNPQYILNACCQVSCNDPKIASNFGVKCGNAFGTGFVTPAEAKEPQWGIVNYTNLGIQYRLYVIGWSQNEFLIVYGCVTYTDHGKTKTYIILRVLTREQNPSKLVLKKINDVLNRNKIDNHNYRRINQGPTCRYVY